MCLFQSGDDIPPLVRLSLRTLQYLVIPLLSFAIMGVGIAHVGKCPVQPNLPVWHIVAGSSGLLIPILYLLFDEVNPRMSRTHPGISEVLDNIVVMILPLYLVFEVAWLITGSVWVFGSRPLVTDPTKCDYTIYVFTIVVIVNFWIHLLTPLIFMTSLCCTRLFPYCGYCAYWNILKTAIDNWTRRIRMIICTSIALPLGLAMVITGGFAVENCKLRDVIQDVFGNQVSNITENHLVRDKENLDTGENLVPIWLLAAGAAVLLCPPIYLIYDKYCKAEEGGPLFKNFCKYLVITYLLCGLAWAIVGFVWVFGTYDHQSCGGGTFTYQFAFAALITLNTVMDFWICFKICVVLYWAFLSED